MAQFLASKLVLREAGFVARIGNFSTATEALHALQLSHVTTTAALHLLEFPRLPIVVSAAQTACLGKPSQELNQ